MIEYSDSALRMNKKYPSDLMTEISYGDLLTKENPAYRLSRDKDLLQYVYDNNHMVGYVIFINKSSFDGTFVDIIKSQNALEIIKLLYDGYRFHCPIVGSAQFGMGVSVSYKGGDTDL